MMDNALHIIFEVFDVSAAPSREVGKRTADLHATLTIIGVSNYRVATSGGSITMIAKAMVIMDTQLARLHSFLDRNCNRRGDQ